MSNNSCSSSNSGGGNDGNDSGSNNSNLKSLSQMDVLEQRTFVWGSLCIREFDENPQELAQIHTNSHTTEMAELVRIREYFEFIRQHKA